MGMLFDLFSVIIALSLRVLYALLLSLPSLLPVSLVSFSFGWLSFSPSLPRFALWDLVPACLTSLTMKQMLILIILRAEISL